MSSSPDKAPKLYAAREPVFPRRVSGAFRRLKWGLMIFTLGVYYLTPWIRWDRGPNLPDQAVLIDLAHRRFYMFWIEIWPYEFYFVAGLLIMAGLGLFLFTSALGRVWCGYACPQTVWTDLFILVERWVEGDRNARVRLHKSKWDLRKWRLSLTKWAIWLAIAMATGGAWVFYFADAPTLFVDLFTGQAAFVAYGAVAFLTGTTFLFGGFAREQICTYMCPWPRIQGAMMDEDTLTIGYRDWRGEPRGKHRKSAEAEQLGDCIDCMACVNVCPVGIDIRDGQQLECITCALCIDACDDVMTKIGKPRGLIDYMAVTDEANERAGKPKKPIWKHIIRLRTMIYTALWAAVGAGLIIALFTRAKTEINVTPVRNPVYVILSDGSVRNTYDIRILNKQNVEHIYDVQVRSNDGLKLSFQGTGSNTVTVPADSTGSFRVFITAPAGSAVANGGLKDIHIWVEDWVTNEHAYSDSVFNGKGR
jgi:cytochrome c oxidase accessory protein FixG